MLSSFTEVEKQNQIELNKPCNSVPALYTYNTIQSWFSSKLAKTLRKPPENRTQFSYIFYYK